MAYPNAKYETWFVFVKCSHKKHLRDHSEKFLKNSVWDDTRKLLKVILGLIIALCLCRRMFSFLGVARCIACEAYAAYSLFWNSSAREERREEREIKKVLKMSNLCDE